MNPIYFNSQNTSMGHTHASHSNYPINLSPHPSQSLPKPSDHFTVRQILTQSPEQHHNLIAMITKYKQYNSPHIVKLIDSHSVESHNLCSVVSHLYVVIERPKYGIRDFFQEMRKEGRQVGSRQLQSILLGCCKGIQFLRKNGQEISHLNESQIYIDVLDNGDIVAKIMNPYFLDQYYEEASESTVEQQLASIIKKFGLPKIPFQLLRTVDKMQENKFSLAQIIQQLEPSHMKKTRSGIKLLQNHSKAASKRESLVTIVSNTSSLMIDGDVNDRMLKDFYEHFDDDISQIHQESSANISLNVDPETSHNFPRKYLKSKAFKKGNNNNTFTSTEWLSCRSICSDKKVEGNITRDESWKENMRIESNPFLLQSAKMVESYIDQK